jgi:hypothetical protein
MFCATCLVAAGSFFGLSRWMEIQPGTQAAFLGFTLAMIAVWMDSLLRRDGQPLMKGQKILLNLFALVLIPAFVSFFNL